MSSNQREKDEKRDPGQEEDGGIGSMKKGSGKRSPKGQMNNNKQVVWDEVRR